MTNYGGLNTTPRVVLVIGETPIAINYYNLLTNNALESDTLNTGFPSHLVDLNELFAKYQRQNLVVPVEIWAGFVNQNESQEVFTQAFSRNYDANDPNNTIKENLLESYKEKLIKRWSGYLASFEFTFSSTGTDDVKIFCYELIQILHRFKFEYRFEDANATVSNIIGILNSNFKQIKFNLDPDLPAIIKNFNMGLKEKLKDDGSSEVKEKIEYTTAGKTVYDIIKDICDKLDLTLIQDKENQLTYTITFKQSSKTIYEFDRAYHFDSLQIRNAKVGDTSQNGYTVYAISQQKDGSVIVGCSDTSLVSKIKDYKELFKGKTVIRTQAGLDQDRLNSIALNYANNLAKYQLSGNFSLKNPVLEIYPNDSFKLIDTSFYLDNRTLTNFIKSLNDNDTGKIWFTIDTINESYSSDGISQVIEFYLNPSLNVYDSNTGQLIGKQLIPSADAKDENSNNTEETTMPPFLLQKMQNNFI